MTLFDERRGLFITSGLVAFTLDEPGLTVLSKVGHIAMEEVWGVADMKSSAPKEETDI